MNPQMTVTADARIFVVLQGCAMAAVRQAQSPQEVTDIAQALSVIGDALQKFQNEQQKRVEVALAKDDKKEQSCK